MLNKKRRRKVWQISHLVCVQRCFAWRGKPTAMYLQIGIEQLLSRSTLFSNDLSNKDIASIGYLQWKTSQWRCRLWCRLSRSGRRGQAGQCLITTIDVTIDVNDCGNQTLEDSDIVALMMIRGDHEKDDGDNEIMIKMMVSMR